MAFEALPGLLCTLFLRVGGGSRDSTFVSSTCQSHLFQVHIWSCVLSLEHFTIYQLNRQMLNHFLHLLNLCCFRQPANTTHSTLSREAASKHAIPSFSAARKEGGRKVQVLLDKLLESYVRADKTLGYTLLCRRMYSRLLLKQKGVFKTSSKCTGGVGETAQIEARAQTIIFAATDQSLTSFLGLLNSSTSPAVPLKK